MMFSIGVFDVVYLIFFGQSLMGGKKSGIGVFSWVGCLEMVGE